MRKSTMVALGLSLIMALGLTGCGGGQQQSAQQPEKAVELKLGHGAAAGNPRTVAADKFAELVQQKTKGKVVIKTFPNEVLGHELQMLEAVKIGTLDITLVDAGSLAAMSPKMSVISLPYLFKDSATAFKVLDGPLGKEMAEPLTAHNLIVLNYWDNGFRELTNSKRPINTPADLGDLKIRVPEVPVSIATFKALGTNPTPMAFGQLYTALQSKVVDGQENPLPNISSSKLYEVQKYLSITDHQYSSDPLIISKKVWDAFSPEIKKAVQEAADEALKYDRELVKKQTDELLKGLADKGMSVNKPDQTPFREATRSVYKEYEGKIPKDFFDKLYEAVK